MATLPSGTVTFLFSDIEGSTRLLQKLGDRYGDVLGDHRRLIREALAEAGGKEIDSQGDAFFFSFSRARDAVQGAVAAQLALAEHPWPDGAEVRVRMGVHTGEPTVGEEGYLGLDVVRAARICSAGRGGQILISETTRVLIGDGLPEGVGIEDLGEQELKDVRSERLFQLVIGQPMPELPPKAPTAELEPRPIAVESRADQLGEVWGARIEQQVTGMLQRALAGAPDADARTEEIRSSIEERLSRVQPPRPPRPPRTPGTRGRKISIEAPLRGLTALALLGLLMLVATIVVIALIVRALAY